jgi:predicted  nucleic acid-binding Zn-ribbon protein
MLEQKMQGLQDLPRRFDGVESKVAGLDSRVGALESQVLQLRQEMKREFSATRSELRAEFGTASASILKAFDETNTLMRVLHEDALSRIATMGEGKRRRGR